MEFAKCLFSVKQRLEILVPPQHKADLTCYSLKNEIDLKICHFSSSIFESGDCGDCPRPPSSSLNPVLLFTQQSAANTLIFAAIAALYQTMLVFRSVCWLVGLSVSNEFQSCIVYNA